VLQNSQARRQTQIFYQKGSQNERFSGIAHRAMKKFCFDDIQKRKRTYFMDGHYLGMEFCTGCWLEGGEEFGNMLEAIRYFNEQKKIFIVHFRNVSATLPHFTETFLDNGYMDMYQVMKTFCEISYDGTMILDHTPHFAPGFEQGSGTAYAIGYMRALMERAEAEL
jgi:mannonate dehydratase